MDTDSNMKNMAEPLSFAIVREWSNRKITLITVDKERNPTGSDPIRGLTIKSVEADTDNIRLCLSGSPDGDIMIVEPVQETELFVSQYGGFLGCKKDKGKLAYVFLLE